MQKFEKIRIPLKYLGYCEGVPNKKYVNKNIRILIVELKCCDNFTLIRRYVGLKSKMFYDEQCMLLER